MRKISLIRAGVAEKMGFIGFTGKLSVCF